VLVQLHEAVAASTAGITTTEVLFRSCMLITLLLLYCRFIQETSAFQKYVAQPKGSKDVQLLQNALQEAFLTIDEALKKVYYIIYQAYVTSQLTVGTIS
jgi:hypothetical protein